MTVPPSKKHRAIKCVNQRGEIETFCHHSDTDDSDDEDIEYETVFQPEDKLGYIYSKGLTGCELPEILAVDVEKGALTDVKKSIQILASEILEQDESHPALKEPDVFTRRKMHVEHEEYYPGYYIHHFTVLLVTDPRQLEQLFTKYVHRAPPSGRLILLMPICQGETWGSIPAAPEGRESLRNSIMSELEGENVNVSEFGGFLHSNPKLFTNACNVVRVSLGVTGGRSEWKIDRDMNLLQSECAYLAKYRDHFAGLCLDGVSHSHGMDYILKVCSAENIADKYRKGIKIGEYSEANQKLNCGSPYKA